MVRTIPVLATLDAKLDPAHTALLVVDMQNDFCHPDGVTAREGGRDVRMAQGVIPTIAQLADACRAAGGLVVYVLTSTLPDNGSHSGPWLDARSRATASAVNICMEGSWGQELDGALTVKPGDVVVKKHRYSAFTNTNLDLILRGHGVRTVVVTGCSTNACVESTLRAGFELDYYIVVPSDGVASWNVELHHATLANVRHRFGVVATAEEIMAIWAKGASAR